MTPEASMQSVLAQMARRAQQPERGLIFDVMADADSQVLWRDRLVSSPERTVQLRVVDPTDPHAWVRALLEYYVGSQSQAFLVGLKQHTIGVSLIRQLLMLQQA